MRLSEYYLKTLSNEALMAYTGISAHHWEYQPDNIEAGTQFVYFCSDCDKFHTKWAVEGWRVSRGRVEHAFWIVDTDGNWDCDSCDVDDSIHETFVSSFTFGALDSSWIEYYEEVLETGEDYFGIFFRENAIEKEADVRRALEETRERHLRNDMNAAKNEVKVMELPDGLVHRGKPSATGLLRTLCGEYVEHTDMQHVVDTTVVTCLQCLAHE